MCVYTTEGSDGSLVYLLLYVDDMLLVSKDMRDVKKLKNQLESSFVMKDLGPARRILGMDIYRNRSKGVLRLSQSEYVKKVVSNFRMEGAKSSLTPMGAHFKLSAVKDKDEGIDTEVVPYLSAVGSIMYAMVGSRPDLAYAVGLVSRFMSRPGEIHWEAVKWLLRYMKGSSEVQLVCTQEKEFKIQGYCDSDYAGDRDRSKSLTGYVFTIGGNVVSWRSCLQPVVALSTTEVEYLALTEAVNEAIWLKGLLEDFGIVHGPVQVWCDSQSAICLSKNVVFHESTKHMRVRHDFIREVVDEGEVEVLKIHTSRNPADILTKVVPVSKFNAAISLLKVTQA